MHMYGVLAVLAALIGLAVCGAAVFTAWFHLYYKKRAFGDHNRQTEGVPTGDSLLLRWMAMDYAVVGLAVFGLLFLFVDVLAVLRDRQSYPYYHYGYLLSGFVLTFLGLLFLVARLFLLLRVARSHDFSAPHHQHKPDQAEQTEQGIQHGQ